MRDPNRIADMTKEKISVIKTDCNFKKLLRAESAIKHPRTLIPEIQFQLLTLKKLVPEFAYYCFLLFLIPTSKCHKAIFTSFNMKTNANIYESVEFMYLQEHIV